MLNKMINPDLSGKRVSLLVLLVFVGVGLLNAQTVIPGGDVTGSWALDSSPYLVEGDITVPNGETLTIDPGVLVEFQGHFALNVQGQLLAVGTAQDSIYFTIVDTTGFSIPDSTAGGWNGIQFEGTPATNDSSKIVHCKLEFGKEIPVWPSSHKGGAILVEDFSKLLVANCNISNNCARAGGGVSIIGNSNPIFAYNKICYNIVVPSGGYADARGGGVYIRYGAAPTFIGNIISNNFNYSIDGFAGGVYIGSSSNPLIQDNIIWRNYGHCGYGGGLQIIDSTPILINNDIQYNHGLEDENGHMWLRGGAISIIDHGSSGEIILINNLIANNRGADGALYFQGSAVNITLINNTIVDNRLRAIDNFWSPGADITIINSILRNDSPHYEEICFYNEVTIKHSNIQDSLGNADGNIDTDPLFYGDGGDYPFYSLTAESPCINAGTSELPEGVVLPEFDLAGHPRVVGETIDMGCYEYQFPQNAEDYELPVNHNYQLTNHPNPFTGETTISFSLTTNLHENAKIEIYNIRGQKVENLQITNSPNQEIIWNGRDETNKPVSSGIYFYKLVVDGITVDTKKMILLK
ncbi:MAG: T9SS type A sorting domain-containing protein [Candidatus Cloacimonetes bacterium]|nr:T9SS type A sorting domain-containing protein [Candidatus Cloacimonadota bacterium]